MDDIIDFGGVLELENLLNKLNNGETEDIEEKITKIMEHDIFKNLAQELDNLVFEPVEEDEIYTELADNFLTLIHELKIENFSKFSFESYDDSRVIIIDGKKYDLDEEFSHDDEISTECLCAIDALCADLESDEAYILQKIEKLINDKAQN